MITIDFFMLDQSVNATITMRIIEKLYQKVAISKCSTAKWLPRSLPFLVRKVYGCWSGQSILMVVLRKRWPYGVTHKLKVAECCRLPKRCVYCPLWLSTKVQARSAASRSHRIIDWAAARRSRPTPPVLPQTNRAKGESSIIQYLHKERISKISEALLIHL